MFDITEVLEQLLPSFPEQPRLITTTPPFLNLVDRKSLEVLVHDLPERVEKLNDLAHNLHRLFFQALRPGQIRTLLGLAGAKEDLQSLLHVVHEVLRSVGVVK